MIGLADLIPKQCRCLLCKLYHTLHTHTHSATKITRINKQADYIKIHSKHTHTHVYTQRFKKRGVKDEKVKLKSIDRAHRYNYKKKRCTQK